MVFELSDKVSLRLGFAATLLFSTMTSFHVSFNALALSLKETFNLTQTQVEIVTSVGAVGYGAGFLESVSSHLLGFRLTCLITGVGITLSAGCYSLAAYYNQFFHTCPYLIYLFHFGLCGTNRVAYYSVTKICVNKFPKKHTGKIIALYLAFAGVGKIWFGALLEFAFNDNMSPFFLCILFVDIILYMICVLLLSKIGTCVNVNKDTEKQPLQTDTIHETLQVEEMQKGFLGGPTLKSLQTKPSPRYKDLEKEPTPAHIDLQREPSPTGKQMLTEPSPTHTDLQTKLSPTHTDLQTNLSPTHTDLQTNLPPTRTDLEREPSPTHKDLQTKLSPTRTDLETEPSPTRKLMQTEPISTSNKSLQTTPERAETFESHDEKSSVKTMLKSPFFHGVFWCSTMFYSFGFTAVNNATTIAQSVYVRNPFEIVYILSVVIVLTRVIFGLLFDAFPNHWGGYALLMTSYFNFMAGMAIGIFVLDASTMVLAAVTIGVGMSAGMITPVSILLWRFGRDHYSALSGYFYALTSVSQIIAQIGLGYFYDWKTDQLGYTGTTCYGRECFTLPFCVLLAVTAVISVIQTFNFTLSSRNINRV